MVRELGDDLILRWADEADAQSLIEFNVAIHCDEGSEPREPLRRWVADLVGGGHPTTGVGDFAVVEDRRTGAIVSSTALISHTGAYDGIEFPVGQPEVVGTLPDYRGRGLARAVFGAIHERSAERGQQVQLIGGIPYFYRQFGYEMTVSCGAGRDCPLDAVPSLAGEEPVRFRPAAAEDLGFLAEVYRHAQARWLLSAARDTAAWRYEFGGRTVGSSPGRELHRIETRAGTPLGFVAHPGRVVDGALEVCPVELAAGVDWLTVAPALLRWLRAEGERLRDDTPFHRLAFQLGDDHPLYEATRHGIGCPRPPYAWYLRVPDLPGFLNTIAPVLEQRLAASAAPQHTGELTLSFYRRGVKLVFDQGRLSAEPWAPSQFSFDAAFPDLTFHQLLFGARSLTEIREIYPDCAIENSRAWLLLNALFPKRLSWVWLAM